ncbi:MAG: tetratricopeptide repeat protein [Gemmatimonadetes bacterium]|nr:tetratricopeptide repeat protein [Gemmatimonadota bacterium]
MAASLRVSNGLGVVIMGREQQVRKAANEGISALRRGRRDEAATHFDEALALCDDLEPALTRRGELSSLSLLFQQAGFGDLALAAAQDALDIVKAEGRTDLLGGDLLAVGNAHQTLGNTTAAIALFEEALALCIAQERWADAASASTNIAGLAFNEGNQDRAFALLKQSLDFLARNPFPHTEIQTRFLLMQGLEITKGDLDLALANAKQLVTLLGEMPHDQREMTLRFIDRMTDRYLAERPQPAGKLWKILQFPQLG